MGLWARFKKHLRVTTQLGFFALTNSNFKGFAAGRIYTGNGKLLCVPGLNCYSCPGALGACPLGSLQALLGGRGFHFPYYVVGLLFVFGALLGRTVCGWLCPFGLVQDLLYKIPFKKKRKLLPGDRYLKHLRYVILVLFVILLPLLAVDISGQGSPWFCKYICPSGTLLAGIPLVSANEGLQAAAGFLFVLKLLILGAILILSIIVYRPFCRYICPLGAIYGFFNPIALTRFRVDPNKCIHCGACQRACGFDIKTCDTPNSPDCIRCGDCIRACPTKAIEGPWARLKARGRKQSHEQ